MQPPAGTPPPQEIRELPALLRRVEPRLERGRLEQNRLDTAHPTVADSIRAVLATLEQDLQETRDPIRRPVGGHPSLKHRRDRLESIPGVGAATAAGLRAVRSEPYGFTDAQPAVAPVGLAPVIRPSGPWAGKTRLSKTGDPRVRNVLYLPLRSALPCNPALRTFCERLKAKGQHGRAILCAAMRKLIHIAFAILKSGKPFDPNFALA